MCAPALPYVAGCLAVAARPPELRRRSGAFGRRWERPPGFDASIGIAEGWHVHTHATLRRGSLPVHQSLAGRQTGAPEGRVQAGAALAAPTDLAAEAQDATAPADKREVACVYKRRFALLPTVDHVDPESTEADFRICGWRTNDCKNDLTITELQVLRSVTAGTVRRAISRIAPARGPRMCSSWRSLHQPPGYRRPVSRSHRTARACT